MSRYDSYDDEDEPQECPICLDELDLTDRSFKPCKCGYQMCSFCWNTINENLNGKCPACRQPYNEENFEFIPPNPADIARQTAGKKTKEKPRKMADEDDSRKHLNNVRVIQRNLVYVTNLAIVSAKDEVLRRNDYFGRFGKINKVVINKSNIYNGPQGPSVSAYVTYFRAQDSTAAIKTMDGIMLDGRLIRCSYGTTKYCQNPDCMYLHELGEEVDSFTKEDMAQGKHLLSIHAIDQDVRSDGPDRRAAPPPAQPSPPLRASQPVPVRPKPNAAPAPWKNASVGTPSAPIVTKVNANSSLNPEEWPDALSAVTVAKKKKTTTPPLKDGALPATALWAATARSGSVSPRKEISVAPRSRSTSRENGNAGGHERSRALRQASNGLENTQKEERERERQREREMGREKEVKRAEELRARKEREENEMERKRIEEQRETERLNQERLDEERKEREEREKRRKEREREEARRKEREELMRRKEDDERKDKEREEKERAERKRVEKEAESAAHAQRVNNRKVQQNGNKKYANTEWRQVQSKATATETHSENVDNSNTGVAETPDVNARYPLAPAQTQTSFASLSTASNDNLSSNSMDSSLFKNQAGNAGNGTEGTAFEEWLRLKFTDLLGDAPPMPDKSFAAPVSSAPPARSRFNFVRDDDEPLDSQPSNHTVPVHNVLRPPVNHSRSLEEEQNSFRSLFPNVNINFSVSPGDTASLFAAPPHGKAQQNGSGSSPNDPGANERPQGSVATHVSLPYSAPPAQGHTSMPPAHSAQSGMPPHAAPNHQRGPWEMGGWPLPYPSDGSAYAYDAWKPYTANDARRVVSTQSAWPQAPYSQWGPSHAAYRPMNAQRSGPGSGSSPVMSSSPTAVAPPPGL